MSSIAVSKRLVSSEEYCKMGEIGLLKPDERVELINGEIFNMTPIGKRHASTVDQINVLFVTAFIDQLTVRIQNPIHIDQWNEPEPDIALVELKRNRYNQSHPEPVDILAVIEVAETTYEYDKKVKLPLYASSGIPLYWIVNLPDNQVEVYSDPRSDQYSKRTIFYPGDAIQLLEKTFEVSEILVL